MRVMSVVLMALLFAPLAVSANEASEQKNLNNPAVRGSIISHMLQHYDGPFTFYAYDPNYLIYTETSDLNKEAIESYSWAHNAKKDEVKFQLSLAFPIWTGILGENSLLGASYTQRSWWQLSNSEESAPFRETNYEPQIFLGWATDYQFAGWTLRDIEVGFNHQSNGREEPTSRSWNRGYARLMAQNGDWQVEVKPWFRFSESGSNDDNPDITKYMGYYRLKVGYALGQSVFSVDSHYNWNTGFGGAELGWSYPITSHVRFYTQLFSGYGESMIDYNFKQTRFGVGVMLNDIM
ncbi:phospholipase A [Serratia sp. S1B]|nr:phospholipase A [Serratia sp. S1B]